MHIKKIQDGVWEAAGGLATIQQEHIQFLKDQIPASPRKRTRICIHRCGESPIHEMIIALDRHSYIRPHKHLGKTESFHLIEGRADAIFFDDTGGITEVVNLAEGESIFYQVSEPCFHMQIVRSPFLVFHEVTGGPFRREDTVFASWSPGEESTAEVALFLAETENKLKAYMLEKSL